MRCCQFRLINFVVTWTRLSLKPFTLLYGSLPKNSIFFSNFSHLFLITIHINNLTSSCAFFRCVTVHIVCCILLITINDTFFFLVFTFILTFFRWCSQVMYSHFLIHKYFRCFSSTRLEFVTQSFIFIVFILIFSRCCVHYFNFDYK